MSFIHDVLTRLDARGAVPPALAGVTPGPLVRDDGTAKRLLITGVLGAAAIAFAALADWPSWLRSARAAQVAAAPVTAATNDETAPAAQAAPVADPRDAPTAPPPTTPTTVAAPAASAVVTPPALRVSSPQPARARTKATPQPVVLAAAAPRPQDTAAAAPGTLRAIDAGDTARIDKRAVAPNRAQRAVLLLRQANEAAQSGQPRAAIALARDALALDASLAPARLLAAVLEHETGASERAAQLLRDGLARDPRDATLALALARVAVAQGDAAGALAVLERHAVQGAEADGLRGGILTQQGDSTRAVPAYENAARQQPANPMWWLGLGVALDAEGQSQRARQAFARALALGLPRDDLALYAEQRLRAAD